MPHIYTTKNYARIEAAREVGFTTVSLQGSSRSSKTYSVVQWLCMQCHENPGTTVSIIRATMPSIRRTVYRDFVEVMTSFGWWDNKSINKSEFVYWFGNGSWIEFFSTDNEQKLRGSKRKILFVNEANELSFLEWQQLQMRTTEFSILDYNPSFSEEHWINQVNAEQKTYWFISTYKDNPFLESKVVEEIESLKWKNPSLWRVYGLGLRTLVEGLVFTNVHYVDVVPVEASKHRFIGMDFGYSHDPTAIVEVYFFGKQCYINELCYNTHMLTDDIIRVLKEIKWMPKIISECADPRLIDEIYNAGLDIHPVKKFPGSVKAGITKMLEYDIYVTKTSTNVKKEFNNYTWRQDKEGKWLNEPIDAFNHCFTGDTLIMTSKGNKRIDKLAVGEKVLTSRGYRKVTKLFIQGRRKIWLVRLNFGKFFVDIQATPDHKIKTANGWKELQYITAKDTLFLCKCLMEKNITYIVENGISREERIDCTATCGHTITEQYQQGITYTTKTAIHTTIKSKISKWLNVRSICRTTHKNTKVPKDICSNLENAWRTLPLLQSLGINQRKAKSGIRSMAWKSLKMHSYKNASVNAAEKSISEKLLEAINSAPIIARANGGENKDLITRNEYVRTAEKLSPQTNIIGHNFAVGLVPQSITVLEERIEQTYDIEVEEAHEFFANGMLVHNCIDSIRYVFLEEILGAYGKGMKATDILDMFG